MREMMMKMMVEMMWEMMLETMLVGILQAWILGLVEIPQLGLELLELGERGSYILLDHLCNALNLGVEFFLLFSHQIRVLLSFLFLFRSFFPISNQYGDRCPCHV
jgi:hypothetical protein